MKNIKNFNLFNEDVQPTNIKKKYNINNSKDLEKALISESKINIKNVLYSNFKVDILSDKQVKVRMELSGNNKSLIHGSITINKPKLDIVLVVSSLLNGDSQVKKSIDNVQQFFDIVHNVAVSA